MFPIQGNQPDGTLYVDDVFSTYLYTGNGSTQTITNGIDLAGKGGLVWCKSRGDATNHALFDTNRGINKRIQSNTTNAEALIDGTVTSFNSNGFTVGYNLDVNGNAITQVSWTFRKAPKFFDVVTYTGNGVAGRTIAHNLGVAPGMIITKRTDSTGDWVCYHRSLGKDYGIILNSTAAQFGPFTDYWGPTGPIASDFTPWDNTNGRTYVAYLFAHDTSADGIIQCGSFTASSGQATISLGWEPQFVLLKQTNGADNWYLTDSMREFLAPRLSATQKTIKANLADAEAATGLSAIAATSTGFFAQNVATTGTYIYLAIRRPNKPPTSGTQVYNAIARTGTGAAATVTGVGFAPDLFISQVRTPAGHGNACMDRLRGALAWIWIGGTAAETAYAGTVTSFDQNGVSLGADAATQTVNYLNDTLVNHFFKRYTTVFDEICYTGTGSNKTETHNLGAAPELWFVKGRSGADNWKAGSTALANTEYLVPNSTSAKATDTTYWNSTYPTSTAISLGTAGDVNRNASTYVAYLFATKAGISKVGSYTGNGSSQTINCGFTTGARFILIKRTDSTGDWFVWDSTRGIIAGNDPHLSLNTTAAEVTTDDSVDPDNSGFIVNELAATHINVTSATYIYLALA